MVTFKQDRETEAREALLASQIEAFQRFLEEKHPGVRFGIALLNAVREYMEEAFLTASTADFEYALQNINTKYMRQHVPTVEETKAALIDKIMELLQATNNHHWKIPHNVQTERTKMAYWGLPQLTARLDEVVRAQTMASKSSTELHQIVESGRKYQGYPQLGKTVVPPGSVHAVPQDAAYLKSLDPWELKKLCRLYGLEQVNARLRGEQ